MRYELIAEKGKYALVLRGCHLQQYAVVCGLDKETGEWDWTCCYYDFGEHSELAKEEALAKALDGFFEKTDEKYIAYNRMRELVDGLIAGLVEDGKDEAYEYMCNVMEVEENEAEILGLDMEKYREKADNVDHYIPSSTSGDYSLSHPWDAPGMSIRDFI